MTQTPARPVVDLMNGSFYADDPHAAWTWMRRNEPVYHDEANDIWAVTRYQDVRTCSTDPQTFSNASASRPKSFPTPMMIDTDPPTHSKRRKLVSSGFTPRQVAELRELVAHTCDEVLDGVCERSGCDFVADVAAQLPLIMIGDLLGVAPQDRADLLRWSDDMLLSQGAADEATMERAMTAFVDYQSYILPIIEQRRATGFTGDLIGILANAEIEGDRLTDDDLVFDTLLILVGGDETTRHVISGGMLALLENREQLAALRDNPGLLPGAVEEMLRWVSPLQNMARTLTRDTDVNGVHLREGDQLLLFYPSANRDESVFDNPFAFDVARDPNPHIAFGLGNHFCLGNQLARLELLEMFPRLLERMPDLRLSFGAQDGAQLPRRASNFVSGLETMPVEHAEREAGELMPDLDALNANAASSEHPTRRPAVVAGASAGIGAEIARTLGAQGYPVALGARRLDRCQAIAREIHEQGGDAFAYRLDVADTESVVEFAAAVADRYGDTEVVVANAGTMQAGAVADVEPDVFAASLNINVVGVQRLVHAFLPGMITRRRGDFVLISSEVVTHPRPLVGSYVASKWGAEGLARTLQMETEGTGVRVSIVQPGPTASEIATGWDMDDAMKVVRYGKKFGTLRHFGFLPPVAIARTVAHVVGAPRGTHIAMSYVAPEAPVVEEKS